MHLGLFILVTHCTTGNSELPYTVHVHRQIFWQVVIIHVRNTIYRMHLHCCTAVFSLSGTAITTLFSPLKSSTTLISSLLFLTTPVVFGKLLISYFVANLHHLYLPAHHLGLPHSLTVSLPTLLTKYPNCIYLLVLSPLLRLLTHLRH